MQTRTSGDGGLRGEAPHISIPCYRHLGAHVLAQLASGLLALTAPPWRALPPDGEALSGRVPGAIAEQLKRCDGILQLVRP